MLGVVVVDNDVGIVGDFCFKIGGVVVDYDYCVVFLI